MEVEDEVVRDSLERPGGEESVDFVICVQEEYLGDEVEDAFKLEEMLEEVTVYRELDEEQQ